MAAIPPVDYARLKLLCILEGPGAAVLRFILKCLTKLPDNWMANFCKLSNTQKNKQFSKTEINQINADPTGTAFDITLLYKIIRFACEIVKKDDASWKNPNSLEGLIRQIKEERNKFVHERPQLSDREFEVKLNELKVLFEKAFDEAQNRYHVPNVEFTHEKSRIDSDIQDILNCFTVEAILRLDIGKGLPVFKKMLDSRLRDIYERSQILDPLCFLSGISKKDFNVQDIFTQISIKEESKEVNDVDILEFTRSLGHTTTTLPLELTHPQLLLIKGVAGSGKTTLITFILSEWLKDESHCRINDLSQYDLILHIVCRESNCTSLEEHLELVLPEIKAFKPYTMTLLRECKLLFLIDGLDERNNSSRELVDDILRQCEMLPTCTIICSSRPETAVDFYQSVSNKYRKGEGMMKVISLNKRTKLVLQHYDSLGTKSVSDRDRLKQVMKKIGWRDHFGLPLNLLFLATLFHEHPDSVRENTTQTRLYIATHDWSIDKLQYRLAKHSQTKHLIRLERNESIDKVLDLMYQVALGGLLNNRMFLSAEDMSQLRECCKEQNLPREEMLGAFFSLRETRVGTKVCATYCTPHKGLQEYLAAKYVMHTFECSPEKSLRQLLLEPAKETLQTLRNFLLHVAGLISQPGVKCSYKVIQVVDLLQKSGMKSCNDWLSLLEDTEVNRTILECVVRHITKDNNEEVVITDSTIISAMELLPLIPSKKLTISLHRKELDVDVHQFGQNCAHHTLTRVFQHHHFHHPTQETNSDSLLRAITKSHLERFYGHLSVNGLALLPPCLEYLELAVHSNHHCDSIITALSSTHKTLLPHLGRLYIHVPMAMIEAGLPRVPLPDLPWGMVWLYLSGVEKTNIQKVCQVCVALQPESEGYSCINFPLAKMEGLRDWRDLLHQLKEHKVRVWRGSVVVPPRTCTEEEREELNRLTEAWWGCGFYRVNFVGWEEEE